MVGYSDEPPRSVLTDTHCHLYMERFEPDRPAVIARAVAAGITRMLVPGLDTVTSHRALELAREYEPVYCAVGIHPTEAGSVQPSDLLHLKDLCSEEKVVAVGEVGLDHYWVRDMRERSQQRSALEQQLELARACSLPVVLHLREQDDDEEGPAAQELLAILRTWTAELAAQSSPLVGRAGVLHSFSGSADIAIRAVELGFYIGVTGPITYPRSDRRRATIKAVPPARILIETDSPFLAPQQERGHRNEPAFVVHIADRIAEIQSRTPTQVAESTRSNAARLFAWEESL